MNFHPIGDAHVFQASAHRRMLNLAIAADILNFRIRNAAVVLEKRRQPPSGDVTRFVDCRGQHRAAMLAIPDWIVGPAAKKRYAKWSARDDHEVSPKTRRTNINRPCVRSRPRFSSSEAIRKIPILETKQRFIPGPHHGPLQSRQHYLCAFRSSAIRREEDLPTTGSDGISHGRDGA